MSANGHIPDIDEALDQLAQIVAAVGATDIDDICAILSQKIGCSPEELKAGLTEDPLLGVKPSYDDTIRDIILGSGQDKKGSL